jgi:hypothetical protein
MVRLLHNGTAPDRVPGDVRSTLLAAMPFLLHDPIARRLVVGLLVAMVVGEVVATYLGQASFSASPASGLALGSWDGAALALLIVFVGMLPRIRVEERAWPLRGR